MSGVSLCLCLCVHLFQHELMSCMHVFMGQSAMSPPKHHMLAQDGAS